MSGWGPGDEAVCIRDQPWWRYEGSFNVQKVPCEGGPRKGDRFVVLSVLLVGDDVFLELDRWRHKAWHCASFRKPDKGAGSKSAWGALLDRYRGRVAA